MDAALPHFLRCIFWDNHAGSYGGAIRCQWDADATWTNCTFAFNSSSGVGGVLSSVDSSPVLDHCILAFQTSGVVVWCGSSTYGMPQLNCCNSFGNAGGALSGATIRTAFHTVPDTTKTSTRRPNGWKCSAACQRP